MPNDANTPDSPGYHVKMVARVMEAMRIRVRRELARVVRAIALCSVGLACAPPAPSRESDPAATPANSRSRPYVIVVSIDGFRSDYIGRYHPRALEHLAAQGISARALIPPFPAKTIPSHYTIATGLYPGRHGMVGNNFYDPDLDRSFRVRDTVAARDSSWYSGIPIWTVAEREGVKTGVVFWAGSEASVLGVRPTFWRKFRATMPDSQRVEEGMSWLRLPTTQRPHLLMLYLSALDDTTHRHGPDAPQTAVAVALANRAIQLVIDRVAALPFRDSVNVVVLSDHGMADGPQHKTIALRPMLAAVGIDTNAVRFGDNGPSMSLWFNGDSALQRRTYAALSSALRNARVYERGATPERWRLSGNRRGGDLLVVGELGHVIVRSASDRLIDAATHGWDSHLEEMHGIFIAAGPGVRRRGVIPAFENVHVYPFLAALLGLQHAPGGDSDPAVLGQYVRAARSD